MSNEKLARVSTTIREEEVKLLDEIAAHQQSPYHGNRAAAIRYLIRKGLECEGFIRVCDCGSFDGGHAGDCAVFSTPTWDHPTTLPLGGES